MKARNKLLTWIAAGMIFLGGKGIANADEKKANLQEKIQSYTQEISNTDKVEEWDEINEYGSDEGYDVIKDTTTCKSKEKKAKPYIDPYKKTNDKWKKWLPQVSVQAEVQPSYIRQNEKVLVDDSFNWTYETETDRKYDGTRKNINLIIKQPTSIADLNVKIENRNEAGSIEKNALNSIGKNIDYSGPYNSNFLKIKTFLSREFNLGKKKKASITPRIGFSTSNETINNSLWYLGDYILYPIDAEKENTAGTGILVGLEGKIKLGKIDGKVNVEYANEKGRNKFIFRYPVSNAIPRGWDKGADADSSESNLYVEASLGNDSFKAKAYCDLNNRKLQNSEWDFWDDPCWGKYSWDPSYRDFYNSGIELGADFEKALNKYISANIGIRGTIPLSSGGDRSYSNRENVAINAGIKARFDFSKVDYKNIFKNKQKNESKK